MDITFDVTCTLRAQAEGHPPVVLVYDARGNGGGAVCPTITGDHAGHCNDYMPLVIQHEETVQQGQK